MKSFGKSWALVNELSKKVNKHVIRILKIDEFMV
jgi:hypothetical protein